MPTSLTEAQSAALAHIAAYAGTRKAQAWQVIREILDMSDIPLPTFERAVRNFMDRGRVALHFHPDRPVPGAECSVAEAMLRQGVYRNQFETGLSNGSVSAYPGGERDAWERQIFGGAYHRPGLADGDRPKYGAFDLRLHPDGPAPRFGSCYFLLAPEASMRSTFTYSDSHLDPPDKGTSGEFNLVAAALLKDAFFRETAVGERDLTPRRLIAHLLSGLDRPLADMMGMEPGRNLNHYIEAQVHGGVSLEQDVDALVADPSFMGKAVGRTLEQLSARYSIALYWHMGSALSVEAVPSDFRGPAMPSLAARIARNGLIDASAIGSAAFDLARDPDRWSDRGTYGEVLQQLKLLWHVLVRFGQPLRSFERG